MIHFIHGIIGEAAHFANVVQRLGRPETEINNPTLDYLNHDVGTLIETVARGANGDGPHIVVGNSMGCQLALQMPFEVDHFVMTAPPFDYNTGIVPLRRSGVADWVADLYQQKGNIEGEAAFVSSACAMVEAFMADRRMIGKIREFRAEAQRFLASPILAARARDVTFMIGAQDHSTPPEAFKAFVNDTVPDAQLQVIQDCGHAVPVEHPALVTLAVEAAMSRYYSTERMASSNSS